VGDLVIQDADLRALAFGAKNIRLAAAENAQPGRSIVTLRRFTLAICSLASLTACSGSETTTPVTASVASVTLTSPASTIKATHTLAVNAKAMDASGNAIEKISFAWLSSHRHNASLIRSRHLQKPRG
jgi:hypothetical protein